MSLPSRPSVKESGCAYAGLRVDQQEHHPHSNASRVARILNRYISVWWSPSIFADPNWEPPENAVYQLGRDVPKGTTPQFRYYSFLTPSERGPWTHVRRAAALPQIARLNHAKQLSTTYMGLNLDATHNRLGHL